jgi:hypothetical protein
MDDIEKRGSPRVVLRSVRNYVRRAVPASALHAAYAPSFGEPWGQPQVGPKAYYFTLGGETVNAIETCQRCVGILERAVEEFSKAQAETDRLNRSFVGHAIQHAAQTR